MRRTRSAVLLAVGAGAALFAAGCGAGDDDAAAGPDGKVTLTFMHRWPEDTFAPYFESVAAAYEDENPDVTIEIQAVGNDTYREQLTLLTGQDKLPDLFWATPGNLEREFVNAGLALDLTEALENDGWGDTFDPLALTSYVIDGNVYGIPIQSNYKFLAYNPSILGASGLDVPTTLEDLLASCDTLASAGVTPIAFGNAEGWPAAHYMTVLNGYYVPSDVRDTDYSSIEDPGGWEDPGYAEALDAFAQIQDRCFADASATATFDTARASFLSGDAAMYAGSFGEVKLISDETDPAAFPEPWGIANFPAPADAAGEVGGVAGAGNGIMVKDGPNAEVAVDFLRFLTEQVNAERVPTETGWVSAVTAANTADNTVAQTAQFLAEVVPNASEVNMWLDNALPGKVSSAYSSALEGLLGGQLDTAAVIETLQTTEP